MVVKAEIAQFKAINKRLLLKSNDWTVDFNGSIPKTLLDILRRQ